MSQLLLFGLIAGLVALTVIFAVVRKAKPEGQVPLLFLATLSTLVAIACVVGLVWYDGQSLWLLMLLPAFGLLWGVFDRSPLFGSGLRRRI